MTSAGQQQAAQRLADVVRDEGRRVLATLARTTGSLTVAEDAVADAVETALRRWPVTGVPDEPRAWLTTVARNKALDTLRREAARVGKEADAVEVAALNAPEGPPEASVVRDDLLRLVFTCCHPALQVEAQVALALRTVCGLATADVARLLVLPEATVAKRLTRAKQKIAVAGIPYRVPDAEDLPARLTAVATVVHLVFTAGHSGGETLVRPQLCDEALRLARLLVELMPDESSLQGLLALMLLTDARRATRTDADGRLLTLAEQDRSRWDADAIAEGARLVEAALRRSRLGAGRFELQAAIAACHACAPSLEQTDWADVVALYDALLRVEDTPVVRLNRAVAVGELAGPAAGLAALEAVGGLGRLHLWHACRAELLARLDRRGEAVAAWQQALDCRPSPPEEDFIRRRLAGTTG
ncbi:sigma-70 family RNA polymerase sigma factor [Modestobacter sp. I12A-02628]|uniref:Sigma-70 family RNA polymerase sigma factor n=1 Tax=Goekera deserti TaxID=2497753 RepID=A0A7K3WCM9_9ACTN|nr:sigma-70 family RNA polymerase sigma factor [Goekera deserti]MPQ98507.1 sigma-70 family RNA polymerase sigma factor [Goekera deserti]NDI48337.1 sigma-70 family RNA polymerase sigma factor [Goekera deserti]NEL54086.1 sigma-70 family RNA polymerase sigma factor [Goekera deserti]